MPPVEDAPIELEHAIGISTIRGGLHYHPNGREYMYAAGASIIVCNFDDPHDQSFLRGHDDSVVCVALSPHGTYVASGQSGENADAIVWDYQTKSLKFRLAEHDHAVEAVAFSHDELLLCTLGGRDDGKLIVWDMSNGYIVTVVANPNCASIVCWGGFVRDVKRRDTDKYLFATAGGTKATMWSLDPYEGSLESERITTEGATVRSITTMVFSEDYTTIYCGTTSGDFTTINVRQNKMAFKPIYANGGGVEALLTTQKGGVVTGGGDGTVTAFDSRLEELAKLKLPAGVVALSFAPDGSEIVAAIRNGAIYRLRGDLSRALLVCENHAHPVRACSYARESSDRFATASTDKTLRVWDANDYKASATVLVRDAGEPTCIVYTLDFLISGWTDGRIRAHDAEKGGPLWLIDHAHRGGVTALQLASNQRFVMTGGGEGDVRVWELRSRELVSHLKEHRAKVTGLTLYADDMHALSCSRDRSFLCWELREEKRVTSHTQRMGGINAVALSRDQTRVFSVGQEKRLTKWDLRDPNYLECVPLSSDNTDEATCVAVSHNGAIVATGGSKKMLKLFDSGEGLTRVAEVVGHSGAINDLVFSPDDKQLVTVGEDGAILVWNLYLE